MFEELEKYPESFIQYVEQPIAVGQYDKLKFLKENFRTLVFVDEDVRAMEDIENIYQCVDGINIQGYKSGGLRNLLKMNIKAQNLGLKTMLGCQAESVLGITALSHIANAFDYCDLDGHLLFKEDYFSGLEVNDGICKLNSEHGIGIKLINSL